MNSLSRHAFKSRQAKIPSHDPCPCLAWYKWMREKHAK
jgi:hypothetical protein